MSSFDTLFVRESKLSTLLLTAPQASLLTRLGRELVSSVKWWGGEADVETNRSVIDIRPRGDGAYDVLFRDVVGMVNLGDRQVIISPKIPWRHFAFIAAHSSCAPRTARDQALLGEDTSFLGLLSNWCVEAAETLLKGGLRCDYNEQTDELAEVRGQLKPLETFHAALMARPVAVCDFDELTEDSALNRVVKAAVQRISCMQQVSELLRRRARAVVFRMSTVGPIRTHDRRTRVDRITQRYQTPIALSHLILDGCGIQITEGSIVGTSFLIRTPQLIEDGMRALVSDSLPQFSVTKRKKMLGTSGLSMNPDLVIEQHLAIGDVKYKFFDRDWNRADLYQAVAFATAFVSPRAALIGFVGEDSARRPKEVPVGTVRVRAIAWRCGESISAEQAAEMFLGELNDWLN